MLFGVMGASADGAGSALRKLCRQSGGYAVNKGSADVFIFRLIILFLLFSLLYPACKGVSPDRKLCLFLVEPVGFGTGLLGIFKGFQLVIKPQNAVGEFFLFLRFLAFFVGGGFQVGCLFACIVIFGAQLFAQYKRLFRFTAERFGGSIYRPQPLQTDIFLPA